MQTNTTILTAKEVADIADNLLNSNPGKPMKALWEALIDPMRVGPEVPMAIIHDQRCGIERRSKADEGPLRAPYTYYRGLINYCKGGCTPLLLAALTQRTEVVCELLAEGANATAFDSDRKLTPLHCIRSFTAVRLLVEHGGDVNARDIYGCTPLHYLVSFASSEFSAIEHLISCGADVRIITHKTKSTLLHDAARVGIPKVVDLLINRSCDLEAQNDRGERPLHVATLCRNEAAARRLLEAGCNVNAVGGIDRRYTPLSLAVQTSRDPTLARLLLCEGADVNCALSFGETPLFLAASDEKWAVTDDLIGAGSDIHTNFGTPLHFATLSKGYFRIAIVYFHQLDVNASDGDGATPLHWSARHHNLEAAKALLKKGANVSSVNKVGQTPLHFAALSGQLDIAELFVSHNADLRAKDADGRTPLDLFEKSQRLVPKILGALWHSVELSVTPQATRASLRSLLTPSVTDNAH